MKTELPDGTRRGLVAGAVLLVVIAAAVNVSHTRQNALDHGQESLPAMAIGLIPDVMLVLTVMRLRYHRRAGWAWLGVALSILLVAWSALSEAGQGHGYGGMIMSLVCLMAAIIATGLAHVPRGGESVHLVMAHVEALADDAVRTIRAAHERAVQAHEQAHGQLSRALQEAHEQTARISARAHELETARAHEAHEQAHEETARIEETAGRAPVRSRAVTARDDSVRTDDVARRKSVRIAYEESVRTGAPMDNRALACALFDVEEPDNKQLRAASARKSDWNRALGGAEPADGALGQEATR